MYLQIIPRALTSQSCQGNVSGFEINIDLVEVSTKCSFRGPLKRQSVQL